MDESRERENLDARRRIAAELHADWLAGISDLDAAGIRQQSIELADKLTKISGTPQEQDAACAELLNSVPVKRDLAGVAALQPK
jgi:hypothetical protein